MNQSKDIEFLRPKQIARALSVKTDLVYKWCQRGLLTHYREGGVIMVRPEDLEIFLEKRRIEAKI